MTDAEPAPPSTPPEGTVWAADPGGGSPFGEVQGYEDPASEVWHDDERQLDPRVKRVWQVSGCVTTLFIAGGSLLPSTLLLGWRGLLVPLGVLLVFGGFALWYPSVRYARWRWRVTDVAMQLRRGVVWRVEAVVPYFRIQQIDVEQGPIDRILGLSTLKVTTASAAGNLALPGLAAEEAPRVRAVLLQRASAAVEQHSGEVRDAV